MWHIKQLEVTRAPLVSIILVVQTGQAIFKALLVAQRHNN